MILYSRGREQCGNHLFCTYRFSDTVTVKIHTRCLIPVLLRHAQGRRECLICPKAMGWTPPHLYGIRSARLGLMNPVNGKKEAKMKIMRVGVDLAKNVFHVHGVDRAEKPVWQRRLSREKWLGVVLEKVEPGCEVETEACAGAHHWARELQSRGYTVKLMAPQFVKPYVKSNKNDMNDAQTVCVAMSRPSMRFVQVKSVEQQDIQAFAQSL